LHRRGIVDGVGDDVLQVGVHCALINTHQLRVEFILPLSEYLFSLTSTTFLGLSPPTVVLSKADKRGNPSFLLKPNKLFGKLVHGLGNDASLESLSDAVHDPLLVVFDQHALLRGVTALLPFLSSTQLRDQIESLLLAFKHHVLPGAASQKSL